MQEGKIITAQGVSAGIDMGLYLASQIVGVEKAKAYQLFIEYAPKPPFNSGNINEAETATIELAKKYLKKKQKRFNALGHCKKYSVATKTKTQ